MARIAADERGTVLYEAPGRVAATLRDLAEVWGADRPGAVCRELTKLHETIERGTLAQLATMAAEGTIPARGEFAVVVGARVGGPTPASEAATENAVRDARAAVARLVAEGSGRSEAARQVAAATGLPRRRLYDVEGRR